MVTPLPNTNVLSCAIVLLLPYENEPAPETVDGSPIAAEPAPDTTLPVPILIDLRPLAFVPVPIAMLHLH